MNSHEHAVVVGAGPAGLGAAIGLARHGIHVTLVEQHDLLGTPRRGETIRADPHMEEILGGGFFDKIALRRVNRRRYYSHSGLRHVDRTISNPNIIFSWPDLIGHLAEIARREGVVIRTGMRALRLMTGSGCTAGIHAGDGPVEESFPAGTVFLCGGCRGAESLGMAQDRTGMDMAVHKLLVSGYGGPDDRLEYHFHLDAHGLVVGSMFPRGNGEAELILLNTSGGSPDVLSFEEFCAHHPLFGRLMEGTQTSYEVTTCIPMGGMRFPFSPGPGLVLAGDALGHVQGRGGSGIRTSFLIGHTAGSLSARAMRAGGWTQENRHAFEKELRRHPHVRSLRLHNLVYAGLRSRIFRRIRSPEHMDSVWNLLSVALR
jgi:flavin-dependent dehydrogenase